MTTIEQLSLQGNVNTYNNALLFQNQLLRVRNQHIRDIMSDYVHVPCRMEYVATICGIEFINDAKAGNINAAWYSLESMTKPVIWIVNHGEVGEEFQKIVPLLRQKIKAVILLGYTNNLPSVFSNYVERVYRADHIEHAVELSYVVGKQGDAVLFCPAVNGYDEDYKQKGKIFSDAVKRL